MLRFHSAPDVDLHLFVDLLCFSRSGCHLRLCVCSNFTK